MPRIPETAMRDLWRKDVGRADPVPTISRAATPPAQTAGEAQSSPAVPNPHGVSCKCERCREYWDAYWAGRYDAIAPLTEAYLTKRATLPIRADNLRMVREQPRDGRDL